MTRIAVIGGGLAGLVVSHRRSRAGDHVTLYEASSRVGGQLCTERSEGYIVEHGAEGFVARSQAVPELAAVVGIGSQLVDQLVQQSYGFDGKGLALLAPGDAARFLGFQVPNDELGRGIRSFREGMSSLADALLDNISGRVEIRLSTRVERLETEGTSFLVHAGPGSGARFDAVVIATSAMTAALLLEPAFGKSARDLAQAQVFSSLSVSLAFAQKDIDHPLDGTGFIVAGAQQLDGLRACTWSSSKLPNRAPPGQVLLRLFFRPDPHGLFELSDSGWRDRSLQCLGRVLTVRGACERCWVSRWPDALPLYAPGHAERVRALEEAMMGYRVWLTGAAFHGAGIDATVRSAERVARAIDERSSIEGLNRARDPGT